MRRPHAEYALVENGAEQDFAGRNGSSWLGRLVESEGRRKSDGTGTTSVCHGLEHDQNPSKGSVLL
jgi:hypothetical protein